MVSGWAEFWIEVRRVPWVQTVLSVVALLASIYLSGLVHIWSDDRAAGYPTDFTMMDVGWEILPYFKFVQIANVWLGCAVAGTWAMLIFYYATSFHSLALIFRRTMWILTILFLMRCSTIFATTIPMPPKADSSDTLYTPDNVGLGALKLSVGAASSRSDLIFSGHTTVFLFHACLWWTYFFQVERYRFPVAARLFYALLAACFCAVGPLWMIVVRWHQTVDVIVSVYLTLSIYYIYHDLVWDHRKYYGLLAWLDGSLPQYKTMLPSAVNLRPNPDKPASWLV